MAQLSDDCFAFGGPMMSVDEAVGLITTRVNAIADLETVALVDADGRVLARDIAAPLPLPPFTNSAVDGYAVRNADLPDSAERAFPLDGRIQAGGPVQAPIRPGHTARIFTGAPMPPDAGTVFMQEDVRIDDSGKVVLPPGLRPGANVRPAGEDIPEGHVALRAGQRLRPQHVALAAAFGLIRLDVVRRIRVAVFSTGDELASPGEPRAASQLFDSNRFMLMAMLRRLGCEVSDLGILRDERTSLADGLKQVAGSHDLILTTGGVSTGEEDHVKAAVESAGALTFWRIAIKPGRPVAMGVVAGTPFIGLPGNPVAAFVTFAHVARAVIARLSGERLARPRAYPVLAGFAYHKKEGRREYVRVRIEERDDGALVARKHPREGAGVITSLTETDGLIELTEPVTRVAPGEVLRFLPYDLLR